MTEFKGSLGYILRWELGAERKSVEDFESWSDSLTCNLKRFTLAV